MKHQLIGLRDILVKGHPKKRDVYFSEAWHADSLADYFKRTAEVLATLPTEEYVNLYFTVALSAGKREFVSQKYIPFDIDHVDTSRCEETIRCALSSLGCSFDSSFSMCSGNGVQFYVELTEAFTDPDYFDANRPYYKACADRINSALTAAGLPGSTDTSVFSLARIMRMPGTINEKAGKPTTKSYVIGRDSSPVEFNLRVAAGIPVIEKKEAIVKWPAPDINAVLEGCENIKLMLSDPESVAEPLWYAIASIFFHLHNGDQNEARKRWHQYSAASSKYRATDADRKFDQAGMASGPRTCKSFSSIPGSKCSVCRFTGKITSPILLVGPDHISTKETGFHTVGLDVEGKPTIGKPHYEDLLKWFERQTPYTVNAETGTVFTFNGKFYEPYTDTQIKAFAEKWFTKCSSQKANEFMAKVKRNNIKPPSWWLDTTQGKMNFQNGVLDTSTMEFKNGSHRDHGFLFALSYNYDATAVAPRFAQFLSEVTAGDIGVSTLLKEYGGYALSNDEYWEHKALLLVGNGRNGKSSYIAALKIIAERGHSSVMLRQLNDPQYTAQLEGKLFNVSEETSLRSFQETDVFKAITAGGDISIKRVYERPYTIRNRAKIITSLNEIPLTDDTSHGFFKRMAIAPFKTVFTNETRDTELVSVKFMAERAGILNLLLSAYKDMKARKGLFVAQSGEEMLEEYKTDTDPILSWFKDTVGLLVETNDESSFVSNSDLYSSYRQYCEEKGIRSKTHVEMGRRLAKLIPSFASRKGIRKINGKSTRVILDITLNKEGESF